MSSTTANIMRRMCRVQTSRCTSLRMRAPMATIRRSSSIEKNLAFHLGGHVNHSIWWKNLSPNGGDKPTGELAAALDDAFGSFDNFRAQFTAAANGLQGSGWGVLGYDSLGNKLLTFQLYDHRPMCHWASYRCSWSTCGSTRITCSTKT